VLSSLVGVDQSVFLFLNGWHCNLLDQVMFWGTQTRVWLPLFLLLLYLSVRTYRLKALLLILTLILTITIADQSANLAKSSVQRLRPTHDPHLSEKVHVVNDYRGGQYGFYSSHAANTMAIAIFLILLLKNRYRWIAAVMIPWALFMAYTRLYLGVHYPGDLLAGMVAGGVTGWLGAQLFGFLDSFFSRKSENQTAD
jgi:undecaprenyl-diphosphatase